MNQTKTSNISILDIERLENSNFRKDAKGIGVVLRCRLDGLTLEATGKVIGRTRERVRQMEGVGCTWIQQNS